VKKAKATLAKATFKKAYSKEKKVPAFSIRVNRLVMKKVFLYSLKHLYIMLGYETHENYLLLKLLFFYSKYLQHKINAH